MEHESIPTHARGGGRPVRNLGHLAADNLAAADRVENEIWDACERVATSPGLGHLRRDLTDKPVRFLAVRGTYLLVYDPATDPLEVLRILHGARDVAAELAD